MRRLLLWAWGLYRVAVGRPVHCWADRADWACRTHGWASDEWADAYNENGTCFRLHGHFGPHEWTPDSQVCVGLPEKEV